MPKKYEKQEIKLSFKNTVFEGYIVDKVVKKFAETSGVIFVPKRFVNKRFMVLLIPYEEDLIDTLNITKI